MKFLSTLMTFALFAAAPAQAQQVTQESFVRAYAAKAFQLYGESVTGARKVQADVDAFLKNPTDQTLATARITWTEARKVYSQTEIYRFYGGPIDGDGGPEPLINAWPLDEVYIDQIVERADLFPKLDTATLHELNEKDGEKNISTGWHAIEYMLWGQDTSADGPGNRPASDFATANPLAARRAEYLRAITAILVTDLDSVRVQWDPNKKDGYAQKFVKDKDALLLLLTGVVKMSGAELSQERMMVALDSRVQEEEHSCFSDTTHFDIYYNFIGIKNVLAGGFLDLVRAKDPSVAGEIEDLLTVTENAIKTMQVPFDQAILNDTGRAQVLAIVTALEDLTEATRQGAMTIGVRLP